MPASSLDLDHAHPQTSLDHAFNPQHNAKMFLYVTLASHKRLFSSSSSSTCIYRYHYEFSSDRNQYSTATEIMNIFINSTQLDVEKNYIPPARGEWFVQSSTTSSLNSIHQCHCKTVDVKWFPHCKPYQWNHQGRRFITICSEKFWALQWWS